ncbi:hypothetical protein K439DRAFT_765590 [Ramaria rubella]|nr:hypothetical protein K439DRAFT_765590 [Ramaria rubella]
MVTPTTTPNLAPGSSPQSSNSSYQVLFIWGILGMAFIIITCLLFCTPLGHPLKRRLLRLKSGEKANMDEFEAHTFDYRSPLLGSPAPPYEWVAPPPPPPMAHLPANDVAHIAPTLTHRFSDIPRASSSGHTLGVQDQVQKYDMEILKEDEPKLEDHQLDSVPHYSDPDQNAVALKPKVSPSRPLSAGETGRTEVLEAYERQMKRDRNRALLLQSDERTRRALLKKMPEEDRMYALAL